jgi:hypothetical protein
MLSPESHTRCKQPAQTSDDPLLQLHSPCCAAQALTFDSHSVRSCKPRGCKMTSRGTGTSCDAHGFHASSTAFVARMLISTFTRAE